MPRTALFLLLLVVLHGCYIPITRTKREPAPFDLSARVRDSTLDHRVRVTRLDGRVVEFPVGSQLGNTGVWGRGRSFGARRPIYNVPLDSIAQLRILRTKTLVLPTIVATAAATTATIIAIGAAFMSIWT